MNEREYFEWQDSMEIGGIILENLLAILRDHDVENVADLYRTLYKYTDCGPWLSVLLHDGTWRHSHELDGIQNRDVRALLVGSIVEGSDAEVTGCEVDLIKFDEPEHAVAAFNHEVDQVNTYACALWDEANDEDEEDAA